MSDDSSKWRMDAYYYGFDATGVPAIDRILSAVACAGKGYHHTEDWTEPGSGGYEHLRGDNYVEMIQNAANDAAADLIARAKKAEAEVERLKGVLEFVDLNISKDNEAAKDAIRKALEAKP